MRIRRYTTPQLFLDHSQEWLLRSELKYSQILAITGLLIKDDHPFEPPFYLATIETEAGIIGCAVRPPPDNLVLADVPVEAIPLLVADVATVYEKLPGVTGAANEGKTFAKHWTQRSGGRWAIKNHWHWYALNRVVTPRNPAAGTLRLADASDLDLVRAWALNFARETDTSTDVVAFYERRAQTGTLYIWDDQGPRSLVAVSGVTPNSIRLSGVYTAPDFRRNGYAAVAVASVSQLMLDAGCQFCLLFADISDPSANHLYRKIGYRQIFDKVSVCLSDRERN